MAPRERVIHLMMDDMAAKPMSSALLLPSFVFHSESTKFVFSCRMLCMYKVAASPCSDSIATP